MIRPATRADVAALTAIEAAAFDTGSWSAALVDLELAAPGRVVLVDEQDDRAVGYASAAVIADVADLTRIAVEPSARRTGVARLLFGTLLDEVAKRGMDRMMLEVADTNTAALKLYAGSGFVEIARRGNYYGNGIDAVVMELAPLAGRDSLEP